MARPKSTSKPQETYNEIVAQGTEQRKTSKLYKAQSLEISDNRITDTITKSVAELMAIADTSPLTLADVQKVKAATIKYFQACADASIIPSFSGLSRSMGFSRNALYDYMRNNPTSKTTRWLEIARDTMSDILSESSLRNDVNTISAIFLQKALYGLRDTNTLEINSGASDNPLDRLPSIDDVMAKYSYAEKEYEEYSEAEKEKILSAIPSEYR